MRHQHVHHHHGSDLEVMTGSEVCFVTRSDGDPRQRTLCTNGDAVAWWHQSMVPPHWNIEMDCVMMVASNSRQQVCIRCLLHSGPSTVCDAHTLIHLLGKRGSARLTFYRLFRALFATHA